jgi:hypothetical protein
LAREEGAPIIRNPRTEEIIMTASNIHTPIHTGTINGETVRFFRSPRPGADFPWHAIDDLFAALKLPRGVRRHFRRTLVGDWKTDVRTIATHNGLVTIAAHSPAQGLLDAATEIGVMAEAAERAKRDYHREGGEALKIITAHLPGMASVDYVVQAFKRDDGAGDGPLPPTG